MSDTIDNLKSLKNSIDIITSDNDFRSTLYVSLLRSNIKSVSEFKTKNLGKRFSYLNYLIDINYRYTIDLLSKTYMDYTYSYIDWIIKNLNSNGS